MAAEFLLSYEHRNEVTLTWTKREQDIDGLLVDLPSEPDDVVDAEVVEDGLGPFHRATYSPWKTANAAPTLSRYVDEVGHLVEEAPSRVRGNRQRGR